MNPLSPFGVFAAGKSYKRTEDVMEERKMRKKALGLLLALCTMLFLLPVQAFADGPLPQVQLDLGAANTENDDYKITDSAINLRKEGVVYELTGATDKKIQIWGSNSPDPVKTFYLRLNDATVNGGIDIYNPYGAKLVIEVADGTTNTVKKVYAVDLAITGKGTLNASDLGSTQQNSNDSRHLTSALSIKDTTINVTTTGNPSQWNGICVLDGDANVTYTTATDYAPLVLGQTYNFSHSLTMKGNSKLYCLHSNADDPSNYAVDGLSGYNGSITLQDNAYLEAQGRAASGGNAGCGVVCDGDITVKDNATLKATAQGPAISTWGDVKAFGGKIIAKSSGSNGIYASGAISIGNAEGEIEGFYPALFGDGNVSVDNSVLVATSTDDVAIYSASGTVTLKNSKVDANGADGRYGILSSNGVNASGSWIETTGPETLDEEPDSIENSVLFNGNDGKVIGNASIPSDATVDANMTLDVPEGTKLIVPQGKTLTNNGKIAVKGAIEKAGTIVCNSHSGGTATCKDKAKCDVCDEPYGETDPKNHTNLKLFPAKAATADAEGNIEYWYCDGCGKYFSDREAVKEIKKADTVTAKMDSKVVSLDDEKSADAKPANKIPQTGDSSNPALWIALLFVSGVVLAGTSLMVKKSKNGR